jgi:PEP-CTERM motif
MRRPKARLPLVAALICCGSGLISPASIAGPVLVTPAGLAPGDEFRFVFVTDGTTTATSADISTYDSFVQSQADGATYNGATVNWLAIGSTVTVNAIDHVGVADLPVFLVGGTEVTPTTTTAGLWSGTLLNPIAEDINGQTVSAQYAWTGTGPSGIGTVGLTLGTFAPWAGSTAAAFPAWTSSALLPSSDSFAEYGISQVLVVPGSVPEPSTSSMLLIGAGFVLVLSCGWTGNRSRTARAELPRCDR